MKSHQLSVDAIEESKDPEDDGTNFVVDKASPMDNSHGKGSHSFLAQVSNLLKLCVSHVMYQLAITQSLIRNVLDAHGCQYRPDARTQVCKPNSIFQYD